MYSSNNKQLLHHSDNRAEGIHDQAKGKQFVSDDYSIDLGSEYDSSQPVIHLNKDPTSIRYIKVTDIL
jgi:hypothetical protein